MHHWTVVFPCCQVEVSGLARTRAGAFLRQRWTVVRHTASALVGRRFLPRL